MSPDTPKSSPASLSLSILKEVALYIQDTGRSRAFYEGVLGLPVLVEIPSAYVFFHAGPVMLLAFVREYALANQQLPPHGATGIQHIAFEAPSTEAYEKWKVLLPQKGIAIDREVTWPNQRRSFYFTDPDGHSLEILEPGVWPLPPERGSLPPQRT
jgi:catechol 2,3-dioxygenase-like lactoylglutathione lyase family enzyme